MLLSKRILAITHNSHDHDHHGEEGHSHNHSHGPGGHVHAPANFGAAFAIGIALNTTFVIAEAIFGFASIRWRWLPRRDTICLTFSAARCVDRHDPFTARADNPVYLRPTRHLDPGGPFNAVFLLVAVGAIGWEAVQRLFHPERVAGMTVMVVAAAGIFVNGITAWLFASGRKGDINIRGAYMHMAADAAVSAGVVVEKQGRCSGKIL